MMLALYSLTMCSRAACFLPCRIKIMHTRSATSFTVHSVYKYHNSQCVYIHTHMYM